MTIMLLASFACKNPSVVGDGFGAQAGLFTTTAVRATGLDDATLEALSRTVVQYSETQITTAVFDASDGVNTDEVSSVLPDAPVQGWVDVTVASDIFESATLPGDASSWLPVETSLAGTFDASAEPNTWNTHSGTDIEIDPTPFSGQVVVYEAWAWVSEPILTGGLESEHGLVMVEGQPVGVQVACDYTAEHPSGGAPSRVSAGSVGTFEAISGASVDQDQVTPSWGADAVTLASSCPDANGVAQEPMLHDFQVVQDLVVHPAEPSSDPFLNAGTAALRVGIDSIPSGEALVELSGPQLSSPIELEGVRPGIVTMDLSRLVAEVAPDDLELTLTVRDEAFPDVMHVEELVLATERYLLPGTAIELQEDAAVRLVGCNNGDLSGDLDGTLYVAYRWGGSIDVLAVDGDLSSYTIQQLSEQLVTVSSYSQVGTSWASREVDLGVKSGPVELAHVLDQGSQVTRYNGLEGHEPVDAWLMDDLSSDLLLLGAYNAFSYVVVDRERPSEGPSSVLQLPDEADFSSDSHVISFQGLKEGTEYTSGDVIYRAGGGCYAIVEQGRVVVVK